MASPLPAGPEFAYAAAVFSVSAAVYLATAHPSCAGGDAGELATVTHGLGVAHPPGYPTMTALTWAAERVYLAAGGTHPGLAQNQFHALLSAAANAALSCTASRFTGVPEAGIIAAGVFAFAPIVWTYATHIEVFSLNNLLLNVLAGVLVTYARRRWPAAGVGDGGDTGRAVDAAVGQNGSTMRGGVGGGKTATAGGKGRRSGTNAKTAEHVKSDELMWQQHADADAAAVRARLPLAYSGAFLCGLALTNQHTSVLYVVPWALWVFCADIRALCAPAAFAKLFAAFALGVSPYLYLPLSAAYNPNPNSWGAVATWQGFTDHILRKDYGTFSLASYHADYASTSANWARTWRYYLVDVRGQTLEVLGGFVGVAVAAMVVRYFYHARWRRCALSIEGLFVATLLLYLNFFHYLCNLPIERPLFYGVQQRFWIQPLALVAVLIAQGCVDVVAMMAGVGGRGSATPPTPTRTPAAAGAKNGEAAESSQGVATNVASAADGFSATRATVLVIGCVIAWLQCTQHYPAMDQSGNLAVRDFGRMILDPLPKNSIVLTKGDLMINSARYVQELEGVRPDVRLVDQELMTFPWYIAVAKEVYPDVTFPGAMYYPYTEGAFDIATFFKANKKRRIFLAHGFKDGDDTWRREYTARPFGIIHEVVTVKAMRDLSLAKVERYVKAVEGTIPLPDEVHLPSAAKYAEHTWERVVLNDYWMGRHNIAYTLLQWGQALHDRGGGDGGGTQSAEYAALAAARPLFELLVAHNQPPRGIAHRNLGVTLQSLMAFHPDDLNLMAAARDAFQGYLTVAAPPEAEAAPVRQVVDHYTNYIDAMRGAAATDTHVGGAANRPKIPKKKRAGRRRNE